MNLMDQVHFEPNSGCWLWDGPVNAGGYGRLNKRAAHRLSWEEHRGPIPEGMYVCHRCDTPPCINAVAVAMAEAEAERKTKYSAWHASLSDEEKRALNQKRSDGAKRRYWRAA